MFERTRPSGEVRSTSRDHRIAEIAPPPSAHRDGIELREQQLAHTRTKRPGGLLTKMSAPKRLALATGVTLLLPRVVEATVINCASNCKTCWSSSATACMSCVDTYFLKSFSCLPVSAYNSADESTSCDEANGWRLDTRDNICKRTINDVDYPCEPGTYNGSQGSSSVDACSACTPGK